MKKHGVATSAADARATEAIEGRKAIGELLDLDGDVDALLWPALWITGQRAGVVPFRRLDCGLWTVDDGLRRRTFRDHQTR